MSAWQQGVAVSVRAPDNLFLDFRWQGVAVSVRAPDNLFLGFRLAEADFSYFCTEITSHTNVPLWGSLSSSQLSCFGIPLDMLLVGPEEGI